MAHKKCQYFLNTYIKGKEKIQLYNTNESCFEASEPKQRSERWPEQYRPAFGGREAECHESRPGPLETRLELYSQPFERLMSFNHFSEPLLTEFIL